VRDVQARLPPMNGGMVESARPVMGGKLDLPDRFKTHY